MYTLTHATVNLYLIQHSIYTSVAKAQVVCITDSRTFKLTFVFFPDRTSTVAVSVIRESRCYPNSHPQPSGYSEKRQESQEFRTLSQKGNNYVWFYHLQPSAAAISHKKQVNLSVQPQQSTETRERERRGANYS